MALISLLDDRARPKGTRDPLGFEMVWAHFGRKVVGNLTTITRSWRIFAVGLLGFHWVNQICRDEHPKNKQLLLQEHFVRYEQLAAYLRFKSGDEDTMGITRVRRRMAEGKHFVTIGLKKENLILSDQISYGIWGMYSTALRETGLVDGNYRELTERGLEIVKEIEYGLNKDWYWPFIRGEVGQVANDKLEKESPIFTKTITSQTVKHKLIHALLEGAGDQSGTRQCQTALHGACRKMGYKFPTDIDGFIKAVKSNTDSTELKQALRDIQNIELLLVTANTLFNYFRRKDGTALDEVVREIVNAYGSFDYLPDAPDLDGCPYREDLEKLHVLLRADDVKAALLAMLALNKKIMDGRGGAPWVEEQGGKLRVRIKSEKAALTSREELRSTWHYDYFLGSYARIAAMEAE